MLYVVTFDVEWRRGPESRAVIAIPRYLDEIGLLPAERAVEGPFVLGIIYIDI